MTTITLRQGDVVEQLKRLADDSVDVIITDPPYNLIFMGKKWDNKGTPKQFEEWCGAWATECLRVLRSGGYLLSFGGTRTFHRITSGIEDAGFVIKDCLSWNYGSGFPKSHNISKAIDKKAGAEREVIGMRKSPYTSTSRNDSESIGKHDVMVGDDGYELHPITAPATAESAQWEGYGTALKPAWEPIILAQKPFKGTIVNNVITHGVGGMNIDVCRISHTDPEIIRKTFDNPAGVFTIPNRKGERGAGPSPEGRWPANAIFDEEAGQILDSQSGTTKSNVRPPSAVADTGNSITHGAMKGIATERGFGDSGGASRFFYCPKTPKKERSCLGHVENKHPTVKPLKLMEYLTSLVCPSGEAMGRTPVVLDCFVGSGSTAIAAHRLGFDCIGIDADEESLEITYNRLMNDWRLEEAPKPNIEGFIPDDSNWEDEEE